MCKIIPAAKWELDMRYVIGSTLTLIAVLLGIVVGLLIAPYVEKRTEAYPLGAQTNAPAQRPVGQTTVAPTTAPQNPTSPKINPATPQLSAGTIAAFLLLSHHLQSDELVVNGYDILKLQESELELLTTFVPRAEVQKAVDSARVSEIYQVPPQGAPPATPPPATPPPTATAK